MDIMTISTFDTLIMHFTLQKRSINIILLQNLSIFMIIVSRNVLDHKLVFKLLARD